MNSKYLPQPETVGATDNVDEWGRADGDEVGVAALAPPLRYQQTSPCEKHDCRHGVCLANRGGLGYRCQCDPGYEGKTGDKLLFNLYVHVQGVPKKSVDVLNAHNSLKNGTGCNLT